MRISTSDGKHGEETTNRNGLMIIDFSRRIHLKIDNTHEIQTIKDK